MLNFNFIVKWSFNEIQKKKSWCNKQVCSAESIIPPCTVCTSVGTRGKLHKLAYIFSKLEGEQASKLRSTGIEVLPSAVSNSTVHINAFLLEYKPNCIFFTKKFRWRGDGLCCRCAPTDIVNPQKLPKCWPDSEFGRLHELACGKFSYLQKGSFRSVGFHAFEVRSWSVVVDFFL